MRYGGTVGVPRIIHQTWKSDRVPASLAGYQESWKRLNPSWEYRLWTDDDNDALVRDEFPALLALYRSLPRAIHRADFARLLYLWRFGGLYVDLDIEALRPADEILEDADCVLGCEPKLHAERLREAERIVCNAAMASVPDHPFWEQMVKEIAIRARQSDRDPVWMTGPLCLQAAYEQHGEPLGVALWDPDVFFPLPDLGSTSLTLTHGERQLYERMMSSRCYPTSSVGVHHWAHTWIPMHPVRNAFRKITHAFSGAHSVVRGRVTTDELTRPERYGVDFPEVHFPPRASQRAEYEEHRDTGYEEARRTTVAIGVLIHNRIDLARILRKRLEALAGMFGETTVYIMGEDSTDGTETVVREWRAASPSLVRSVAPITTSATGVPRIAELRNALLDAIDAGGPIDFVGMLDGDLEGPVSLDGVAHSIGAMAQRDALSAVAAFGINNWVGLDNGVPFLGYTYYDPLAFREKSWDRVNSDPVIRWRLGRLRRGDPLLPVKSAFAGFAIYRACAIRGIRYETGEQECEHVGFHRALADRGGLLCINPAMLLLSGRQGHHERR